ncbi:conserved hypothetical protein [Burkholderia sp. H160]|nr:conserved hypothetical protein [Burkholderia sp. H160]
MKRVTIDMLRAHLLGAFLTAVGAEIAASGPCRWLAVLPLRLTGQPFVLAAH